MASNSSFFVLFAALSLLAHISTVHAKRMSQSEDATAKLESQGRSTDTVSEDAATDTVSEDAANFETQELSSDTAEDAMHDFMVYQGIFGDNPDLNDMDWGSLLQGRSENASDDEWTFSKKKKANSGTYDGKKYESGGAKWDPDGVPLEDSNVANMNSDEAKAVRKKAAQAETAWKGVGKKAGLWVWRIEQFKVVKWPKKKYGQFHKGDSYIVLHVKKEEGKLVRNIHFWLGTETSIDEKGTAAYKTVELDDYFGGEPVQHREVMNHESQQFRSLFSRITYLDGGVTTGFNPKAPMEYRKTLMIVRKLGSDKCPAGGEFLKKKGGSYCIMELPMAASSLNQGDCFLLWGKDLNWWCGSQSSGFERSAVSSVARDEKNARPHHTKTKVVPVDDDKEFCDMLGGTPDQINPPVEELKALTHPVLGEGILYELSDDNAGGDMYKGQMKLTFTEKARGDLKKSMLNPDNVMIVDTDSELFVWIGSKASDIERRNGLRAAMTYLDNNGKSQDTAIHVLKPGDGAKIVYDTWNKIFDN